MVLVSACAPPGGGRNEVTPRFFRHFNMLNIAPPSQQTMQKIFLSIVNGFLDPFLPEIRALSKPVVDASVEVYERICKELLPTPAKSHYTFNLRDLSKVVQGVLQARPSSLPDKVRATVVESVRWADACVGQDALARLWVHEAMRVFYDRLINKKDRRYFTDMLVELLKRHFSLSWSNESFEEQPIIFGDFMRPGLAADMRVYEQVKDINKCVRTLEEFQEDYNAALSKDMNLVFFMDAIEHVARISRIIRQRRGNAMLVGVGGTGKKSLTRLACFMAEYTCFTIELTKGYGVDAFHEDLKKLYTLAGVKDKPVVFLFSDTQIIKESFLEDINNILNSGEVPNLFAFDETEAIISELRPIMRSMQMSESREAVLAFFINRVRDNLHIVLCMSPVGDSFRCVYHRPRCLRADQMQDALPQIPVAHQLLHHRLVRRVAREGAAVGVAPLPGRRRPGQRGPARQDRRDVCGDPPVGVAHVRRVLPGAAPPQLHHADLIPGADQPVPGHADREARRPQREARPLPQRPAEAV
jgi:dynein heavy chain